VRRQYCFFQLAGSQELHRVRTSSLALETCPSCLCNVTNRGIAATRCGRALERQRKSAELGVSRSDLKPGPYQPSVGWPRSGPLPIQITRDCVAFFHFRLAKNSTGAQTTGHYLRTVTPFIKPTTQPNAANSAACGGGSYWHRDCTAALRGM